jgi:hypothetical protein
MLNVRNSLMCLPYACCALLLLHGKRCRAGRCWCVNLLRYGPASAVPLTPGPSSRPRRRPHGPARHPAFGRCSSTSKAIKAGGARAVMWAWNVPLESQRLLMRAVTIRFAC